MYIRMYLCMYVCMHVSIYVCINGDIVDIAGAMGISSCMSHGSPRTVVAKMEGTLCRGRPFRVKEPQATAEMPQRIELDLGALGQLEQLDEGVPQVQKYLKAKFWYITIHH